MAKEHTAAVFYEFESEQEALNAQLFQPQNLRYIKNMLYNDTKRLENLVPDPNNYHKFIQEHAEIKGAISAWQHLVNCHEEVINRLSVD